MSVVRHYASVYKEFVSTCITEATSYRVHFVMLILIDLAFYLSSLATVDFIFDYVDMIGPWNRLQFMFFISFMLAVDQIHMCFISEGFWSFSVDIKRGMLDFTLVKPIGGIFISFFRYIRPSSMVNIFFTSGLLVYFGSQLNLGVLTWFSIPFMILLGLALLVSLEILFTMSMFWVVESRGINFIRMQFQNLSRWPDFIYKFYARKFFTLVVPILLIGSAPVKFLLNMNHWASLAYMIVSTIVVWWLIGYFWRRGLAQYESASS